MAVEPALEPARERTATLQLGVEHFLPAQRGSAGLNLFLRGIDDKIQKRTALEAGRYIECPFNVAKAIEASVVADFKWKSMRLPLALRGNASTSRLHINNPGAAFVRQESPRHSASLGTEYKVAAPKLTLGGNLGYSSRFTLEANPYTLQTQRARIQLDLYAVRKLDRALSLRLSIDNLTHSRRGNDNAEFSSGTLTRQETDRAEGMRVVNLSLEGTW